jgi:hypothetical protein
MQFAKQEMRDNDDEDLHEFTEAIDDYEDGTHANSTVVREGGLKQDGMIPKDGSGVNKTRITDGISLTPGDIKKNEEIDWAANNKLNLITKSCLSFVQQHFSFQDYLDERALKDPKFVNLEEEEAKINEDNEEIDLHLKSSEESMSDTNLRSDGEEE